MRLGQLETTSFFKANQGVFSVSDILAAAILPAFFFWTGINLNYLMLFFFALLTLFRMMQEKGKRRAFNEFFAEWLVKEKQKGSLNPFFNKLADLTIKANRRTGCFSVDKPVRYRP